jgi:dihydrofolate synthase/folylpolyglutamate synthase
MEIENHPLLKNRVEWKIEFGLERIKKICSFLKNPQNSCPSILIAGTNGKGTVAKVLSEILKRAGKNTGLFISPHLQRITERISINSEEISEEELENSLDEILKAKEACGVELTYFEVLTASAFLIFSRKNLDFMVLEVGMGGRLDATNIVEPALSIIVSIGHDHEKYLGRKLKDIAKEKAGIVRKGGRVILGENRKFLIDVVKEKEPEKIYIYGKDFFIKKNGETAFFKGINSFRFSIPPLYPSILLKDFGIGIFSAELLGVSVDKELCEDVIFNMRWHGRCEVIPSSPPIIMDGGHNPEAVRNLIRFIKKDLKLNKVCSLLGFMRDKKPERLLPLFKEVSEHIFLTEIPNERSWKAEDFSVFADKIFKNPSEGFDYAWERAKNLKIPLLIGGSFYLLGVLRKRALSVSK